MPRVKNYVEEGRKEAGDQDTQVIGKVEMNVYRSW